MCSKSVLFKYFGYKNPFNSFFELKINYDLETI